MAKQLLGKEVTAALNERIKANVAACQEKGVNPTLCIIRVGENPSDISYEKGATKRCETLGVACEKILLPEDVTQEELLANSGEPDPDNIYTYQSDDSDYHSESYTYEKEAEKYYGNSSYKFEFANDVLAYVTISYTP